MKQKTDWEAIYAKLKSSTPGTSVTKEELYWALENVRSRAFSGPYTAGSITDRALLAAVIIGLGAFAVVTGRVLIEDALNGLIAAFGFNLLYDFFLSQRLKWYGAAHHSRRYCWSASSHAFAPRAPPPPPPCGPQPPIAASTPAVLLIHSASALLCHCPLLRRYAMCPVIDFMNHKSTVEVRAHPVLHPYLCLAISIVAQTV